MSIIIPEKIKKILSESLSIPEDGQTQLEFVKEEIEGKGKKLSDFVASAPYLIKQNAFPLERIKDWPIYSQIEKAFMALDNKSDDTPKEETSSTAPKKEETDNSSSKVVAPVDVEAMAPIEVPDPSILKSVDIKKFSSFSWSRPIPIVTKEKTFVKFEKVGLDIDRQYIVMPNYPQIKPFKTFKEYILNYEELVDRIYYSLQLVGGQEEPPDPTYQFEHTSWGSVGIDLTQFATTLEGFPSITNRLRPTIFERESERQKILKTYFSVTDRFSLELERLAHEKYPIITMLDETEANVKAFRAFYNAYLVDSDQHLEPLSTTYERGYTIWQVRFQSRRLYRKLIDCSNVMRKYVVTYVLDQIVKRLVHEQVDQISDFQSILTDVNVRLNTREKRNDFAAILTARNPTNFVSQLILGHLMSRIARIEYIPKHYDTIDMLCLIDCLMLHLWFPSRLFDRETTCAINNYIYKNLVCKLKGVECVFTDEDYELDRDYLSEQLVNIRGTKLRRVKSRLTQFLWSKGTAGFAEAGVNTPVKVHSSHSKIIGRSVLFYEPFGKKLDDDSKTFSQHANFKALVSSLTDYSIFESTFRNDHTDLINLLKSIVTRSSVLIEGAIVISKILRKISVCPYVDPSSLREWEVSYKTRIPFPPLVAKVPIQMQYGLPTAFARLGKFTQKDIGPIKLQSIFDQIYMNGWLNEIGDRYKYAKANLTTDRHQIFNIPRKLFVSSEIYDYAFSGVGEYKPPAGFAAELKQEFLDRKNLGQVLPSGLADEKPSTIRYKIKKLIDKQRERFGFTMNAVVCDNIDEIKSKQGVGILAFDLRNFNGVNNYYFRNGPVIHRPVTYTLKTIVNQIKNNNFHINFEKHYNTRRPIIFRLPFPISYQRYVRDPKASNASDAMPLEVQQFKESLLIKPLKVYYDVKVDYERIFYYKPSLISWPKVTVARDQEKPEQFFMDSKVLPFLLRSMRMVRRPTRNIKFIETSELFSLTFFSK